MSEQQMTAARDRESVVSGASEGRMPVPHLPAWESFTAGDRQRLVRVILQAAQRQVMMTPQRQEPEQGR